VTGPRLFTPRRLAAGGAVVLAAAVGVTLLLQNGGAACAAPPTTSAEKGKATFYDLGGGGTGNCSFPSVPADDLYVALGPDQYSGSAACGTYLDVTGPKGKVRVKVTDSCPECPAGHLDLSRTAFKKIAAEVAGIVPITYRTVRTPTAPGPISVTVKSGSSQYWLAVLIDNHGTRLSSVKIAGHTAQRADYNYWLVESGAGGGPFKVKITDVYGSTTTLAGIKLSPGRTQRTTARLGTGTREAVKAPPPASPTPTRKKSASPSPSPSASVAATSSSPAALAQTAATAEPAIPTEQPVDLAAARPACR
jgi:expansin